MKISLVEKKNINSTIDWTQGPRQNISNKERMFKMNFLIKCTYIKKMYLNQISFNLPGELDKETMELMSLPRCGVRDKVGFGSDSRSKRYALQGSRWKVKALTYRISKYPKRLDRGEVDKEIAKAFSVWSEYTDLTFTQKRTAPVHIDIRFEENEHGDGDPFDGPGELLSLLKINL